MKTSIQFYCSIIVFFAMVLVSCSKDGDIGPIGPAGAMGEQGITGPAGPAGENGEALGLPGPQGEQGPSGADGQDGVNGDDGVDGVDGEDGNANVLVKTVDLVNYDWLWSASLRFEGLGWFTRYADINVPQINAEIDHNGLVLMYLKADPAGGWQTFPFQFTSSTREYETRIIYKSSVGNIRLHYWWAPVGGDIPSSAQLATYTIPDLSVKYVIIEGNLVSKTPGSSTKKLKNMTYEQVMDHFGLNH